jgi:hypothetical protein
VSWPEAFIVLLVSHLVGDFMLQTDWQATHKQTGLGRSADARRALAAHVATYAAAFIPALAWIAIEQGAAACVVVAAIVLVPHLLLDDGRAVRAYVRTLKRSSASPGEFVFIAVDQSFHVLLLFAAALVVAA